MIQKAIAILLKKIRPQAIPLIELARISDHTITSAIGNSYGDIYETYLEWAKTSKLNDQKDNIPKHFHEYMGPILQGKLWRSAVNDSKLDKLIIWVNENELWRQ